MAAPVLVTRPVPEEGLAGRPLGVVGAGRIGSAVARRGYGLGMHVMYASREPKGDLADEIGATRCDLDELLSRSDVISLHVPPAPDTHHLVDARRLGLMKATAILVNTARGPVVAEKVPGTFF